MTNSSFGTTFESPTKWDIRFFNLCESVANWSEDESRKIGCLIVGDGHAILSTGYNGLPRGIENTRERHDKTDGEKYYWFEHAERNAIFNAVRNGTALRGTRMYVNLFPCADCTRAIIQTGIVELNTYFPQMNETFFLRSTEVALAMLNEAGTKVNFFNRFQF